MQLSEFQQIGTQVFGGTRWGSKMAEATGLSKALVSQVLNGKLPITPVTANKVRALLASSASTAIVVSGGVPGEPVVAEAPIAPVAPAEYNLGQTKFRGERAFKLSLVAQDLLSNRFVKTMEVDPALFFPEFAPQPVQVVQQVVQVGGPAKQISVDDESLSDDVIMSRIDTRMGVMMKIANAVIYEGFPSMIVYGAPGVGKSYQIMKALDEAKAFDASFYTDVIKGAVRAPGLYKALFAARNGGVVVLDDSDSVFKDEDALNLLKAALDSNDERRISWRKQSAWLQEVADEVGVDVKEVRDFEFKGGVIFITNVNLREKAKEGTAMADHFGALISRSFYVDLTMDSVRAKSLWVKKVFTESMAKKAGLTEAQAKEIVEFIYENRFALTEISLRMATMILKVYKSSQDSWQDIIRVTKMA